MLTIGMTAALRPEILARTLESIRTFLRSNIHGFGLAVDIAPVGDPRCSQEDVEEVVNHSFTAYVTRCLEDSPHAAALKWSWLMAMGTSPDFIIQWEDDWVLNTLVNIDPVLDFMTRHPEFGMVYFDWDRKGVLEYGPYQEKHEHFEGGFYRRTSGKTLGGPPAVLRADYAYDVLGIIDGTTCLDVLSRTEDGERVLSRWEHAVWLGNQGCGKLVSDIGEEWRRRMGLRKNKRSERGMVWEKI